jgi:hypothetical protein
VQWHTPESKYGSARCLTEPPILVVFGGARSVPRLTERDAEPALKAATLLGLRVASIEDVAARTVPEAPPQRDIFGHGNGNYGVARMPERRGTEGSDDR